MIYRGGINPYDFHGPIPFEYLPPALQSLEREREERKAASLASHRKAIASMSEKEKLDSSLQSHLSAIEEMPEEEELESASLASDRNAIAEISEEHERESASPEEFRTATAKLHQWGKQYTEMDEQEDDPALSASSTTPELPDPLSALKQSIADGLPITKGASIACMLPIARDLPLPGVEKLCAPYQEQTENQIRETHDLNTPPADEIPRPHNTPHANGIPTPYKMAVADGMPVICMQPGAYELPKIHAICMSFENKIYGTPKAGISTRLQASASSIASPAPQVCTPANFFDMLETCPVLPSSPAQPTIPNIAALRTPSS